MIKSLETLDYKKLDSLKCGHYARKIKSNFLAYNTKYDFCKFYLLVDDDNVDKAVICQFNSTMVICRFDEVEITDNDMDDIATLIFMNQPLNIEIHVELYKKLFELIKDYYTAQERTEFKFRDTSNPPSLDVNECPTLAEVFEILSECFPAIRDGHDLWLTDTSHRVRHGLSQCLIYNKCTTATIQYIIDKVALVGHVGTLEKERGKFHARKLLYWIGERLSMDGLEVVLFARNHRVSYYNEIGFEPIGQDIVFERILNND